MRQMFDDKKQYMASQGSIFNLAIADGYQTETLGLIISARCDIEQKKIKNGYYLATIPLKKWIEQESPAEIKNKCEKNKINELESALAKFDITLKSLEYYGTEKAISLIKKTKDRESIVDKIQKIRILKEGTAEEIIKENKSIFEKIITDIIENKNNDYFYIDNVIGYGACIVKLREIHTIEMPIIEKIEKGLEIDTNDNYEKIKKSESNNICSIIGEVKSPYIELIMQRFANNFVRVGVEDPSEKMIANLLKEFS